MNNKRSLTLVSVAVGLSLSSNTCAAKEVKISSNSTAYSSTDVRRLAATAIGMGVREPVSLNSGNGVATVPGSSTTKCAFKISSDDTSQIQGVNCE